MKIKYEDSLSIHLGMQSFHFMKTYLRRKSGCFKFTKMRTSPYPAKDKGLFIHINSSFEFAIVQMLLFMVF